MDENQNLQSGQPAPVELTDELTDQENAFYEAEKLRISALVEGNPKIHAVVFINKENKARAVCYLKEPSYETKLNIMDLMVSLGIYKASDNLRQAITVKEYSDPITFGNTPDCDAAKMGVTEYCLTMVKRYQNQFKKN